MMDIEDNPMNAYALSSTIRQHIIHAGEKIMLHTAQDFDCMRKAGRLAAQVLDYIEPFVQPGITTGKLDALCHDFIIAHKAIPAPLNYRGFPKSTCTSLNQVVCHGIPSDEKIIRSGDILNIDVTVILDGWYGDTNRTFAVGTLNKTARDLINVTHEAMLRGIDQVKPGATLGDIGHAIQSYAEHHGYSVVRDFCGHGIGLVFHNPPNVLHYGKPKEGLVLQEGMFFTIEPMINRGRHEVKVLADGWTAVTRDKSLSAQFEHTIGVTATGYEIFTVSSTP